MHWLDLLLICTLAFATIKGYSAGVVRQALTLLSLIISIGLANEVTPFLAQYFDFLVPVTSVTWASWILGFILCMIACTLVSNLIIRILPITRGIISRVLGMILALLVGVLMWGLWLSVYTWIAPTAGLPPIPDGLMVYPVIDSLMRTIIDSQLFEVVEVEGEQLQALQII
ncbi:MAG: CvpA family protein [Porphyromonas sp.]|nr:CvpA family protein [Porphyromonas sp.]